MLSKGAELKEGQQPWDLRLWGGATKLLTQCQEANADLDWSGITEEHIKVLFKAQRVTADRSALQRTNKERLSEALATGKQSAGLKLADIVEEEEAEALDAESDAEEEAAAIAEAINTTLGEVAAGDTDKALAAKKAQQAYSRLWYADKESAFVKVIQLFLKHPNCEVALVVRSPNARFVSADCRGALGNDPAVREAVMHAVTDVWDRHQPLLATGQLTTALPDRARWKRDGMYALSAGGGFARLVQQNREQMKERLFQQHGRAPDGKQIQQAASDVWHALSDDQRFRLNQEAADGMRYGQRKLAAGKPAAVAHTPKDSQPAFAPVATASKADAPAVTPAQALTSVISAAQAGKYGGACVPDLWVM